MKQSNISKIAALRKCLNRFAYTHDAMIEHIKNYLGNDLKFEWNLTINRRGHTAKQILIFDKEGDMREITAEFCADRKEFTFSSIGLEEDVYRCNAQLIDGINNKSRINHKHAFIVDYHGEKIGLWKVLISYSTIIAAWNPNSNIIYLQRHARDYSNTTRRHLSDFEEHVNRALEITNETAVFMWANWE